MNQPAPHGRAQVNAGFTLVEAAISISIAAVAGSVLLLGISSSVQSTTDALEQAIADGIAQQLMDEVLGAPYCEPGTGGYQITLGPSSWEASGAGRERFDDIDDYNGFRTLPPEDLWGIALGTDDGQADQRHPAFQVPAGLIDDWQQRINVHYVDESDPLIGLPPGQVSDYRRVRISIIDVDPERGTRELAQLNRVVAYVPPLD